MLHDAAVRQDTEIYRDNAAFTSLNTDRNDIHKTIELREDEMSPRNNTGEKTSEKHSKDTEQILEMGVLLLRRLYMGRSYQRRVLYTKSLDGESEFLAQF